MFLTSFSDPCRCSYLLRSLQWVWSVPSTALLWPYSAWRMDPSVDIYWFGQGLLKAGETQKTLDHDDACLRSSGLFVHKSVLFFTVSPVTWPTALSGGCAQSLRTLSSSTSDSSAHCWWPAACSWFFVPFRWSTGSSAAFVGPATRMMGWSEDVPVP